MISQEALIDIRCHAKIDAEEVNNPAWKRAYLRLADAADHLSLMLSRCEDEETPEPEEPKLDTSIAKSKDEG